MPPAVSEVVAGHPGPPLLDIVWGRRPAPRASSPEPPLCGVSHSVHRRLDILRQNLGPDLREKSFDSVDGILAIVSKRNGEKGTHFRHVDVVQGKEQKNKDARRT